MTIIHTYTGHLTQVMEITTADSIPYIHGSRNIQTIIQTIIHTYTGHLTQVMEVTTADNHTYIHWTLNTSHVDDYC